jgi:hypothetical protein
MSFSQTPHKPDLQNLFSSAFRREDIRNKLNSTSHSRSSSYTFSRKHEDREVLLKESKEIPEELQKTSESFEVYRPSLTFSEQFSKFHAKDDFEYNNDMKYQDMAKRYERMQDFYKTQVCRLTEEVNHYKTLYHKLLIQYSSERKTLKFKNNN